MAPAAWARRRVWVLLAIGLSPRGSTPAEVAAARTPPHSMAHLPRNKEAALHALQMLDVPKLLGAATTEVPFPHIFVEGAVRNTSLAEVRRDFPDFLRPYESVEEATLRHGHIEGAFRELLFELRSPYLKAVLEQVLDVELKMTTPTVTLHGHGNERDVWWVHNDAGRTRAVVFLFLSERMPELDARGRYAGQLRLLRSGNATDAVLEYASFGGNLVAWRNPMAVNAFDARRMRLGAASTRGFHGFTALDLERWMVRVTYEHGAASTAAW